jgi:ribosomal protein L37E
VEEMSVTETIRCLRAFKEPSKGWHDKEVEQQLLAVCGEPRLTRVEWEAKVIEEKRSAGGFCSGGEKYHDKFDKSKIDCRKCGELGAFW